MRVLHIGLSKTGTTSIQHALNTEAHDSVVVTDVGAGWDAAGVRPVDGRLVEWEGNGQWFKRLQEPAVSEAQDLVISQEEICRARPSRIPMLLDAARPHLVVVTHVPLSVAVPRWYTELGKVGAQRGTYAEWRAARGWRSTTPDHDGTAVRPDAVVKWWRDAGADVITLNTMRHAVQTFFHCIGLPVPPEEHRLNVSPTPNFVDDSLGLAQAVMTYALEAGEIADLNDIKYSNTMRF